MDLKDEIQKQRTRKKARKWIVLSVLALVAVALIVCLFLRWETTIDEDFGKIKIHGKRVNFVFKQDYFTELTVTIKGKKYDIVDDKCMISRSKNFFGYEMVGDVVDVVGSFWDINIVILRLYMDPMGDWYVVTFGDSTYFCTHDPDLQKEDILARCGLA